MRSSSAIKPDYKGIETRIIFLLHLDNSGFVFSVFEGIKSELRMMENFLLILKAVK